MADNKTLARFLEPIIGRVAQVDGVSAIVLGGSQARGTADRNSDIDLGLYYESNEPFSIDELDRAAQELDDRHTPRQVTRFGEWGPGVNGGGWLLVGGRHVDFIYRELSAVREAINECRTGRPRSIYQLGHPLGFHNQIYVGEVNCCRPLHDPGGVIAELKSMVRKYPPALRRAIIDKHLSDAEFELRIADKPTRRGDVMYVAGCLFRAAGFLTLVLYALNRRYFLNEKGSFAESREFPIRSRGFHSALTRVLANPGRTPTALARSVAEVQRLVAQVRRLSKV